MLTALSTLLVEPSPWSIITPLAFLTKCPRSWRLWACKERDCIFIKLQDPKSPPLGRGRLSQGWDVSRMSYKNLCVPSRTTWHLCRASAREAALGFRREFCGEPWPFALAVFLEGFALEVVTLPAWLVNTLFRLHSGPKTSVEKLTHGFDSTASCFYGNPDCSISPRIFLLPSPFQ